MKYEIKGGAMPVVECHLDPGEAMKCEGGAMVWMSDGLQMETKGGGIGKMFSKALSGENLFENIYRASQPSMITFGASYMGSIVAYELTGGREIVCQKSAFLCATEGVERTVFFQGKVGAGFFGGEGFIMQKMSGNGIVFVEIDGTAINYDLAAGQRMIIDTGYLAMMDATCSMSIEKVQGGIKNMAFGGEGLFNTVVTGPGQITVQTMPKSAFVAQIAGLLPSNK